MNLQQIESEALHLPEEKRAKLIQALIASLDTPSDSELKSEWLTEAKRRADELDEGVSEPVPASDVLKKARALVK
ncbi:addiction module protein [Oceanospirillum sanctuarii]|uniref:addiction module protein n=1 Tax=Oceanospirillum sanctuarii TaxID=1434821 RepID=UPI000A36ED0F|nr:addiction module protein [Oceanospirillum sanctuarii]